MLLQNIKYDIYDPIEPFLNTRYTFIGLNQFLSIKMITQQEQNQLVVIPNSNMDKRQEFQSFFKTIIHLLIFFISTYQQKKGSQRNTTFRSGGVLHILNYQQDYKLAFIIRSFVIESSYFYYSYKNLIPFLQEQQKQSFDDILYFFQQIL
ncbi:unnamed protein product [Paramecium pentaurelia]|uniref:Uncharacterized protein n=1 Tax=Paramecium pentaurelia TaxID=43138 RepID=A0A8S1UFR3_9CILI|nr:unnamed protein product [Paramecium pentaurelia]